MREVHAWTSATRWNKGLTGRPQDETTPNGVNWDLWLGPREPRGYSTALNPVRWRDFWDFGTAPIGDFFCHNFDPAMWALNLREPLSIEASAVVGIDGREPGARRTQTVQPVVVMAGDADHLQPVLQQGDERQEQLAVEAVLVEFVGMPVRSGQNNPAPRCSAIRCASSGWRR